MCVCMYASIHTPLTTDSRGSLITAFININIFILNELNVRDYCNDNGIDIYYN